MLRKQNIKLFLQQLVAILFLISLSGAFLSRAFAQQAGYQFTVTGTVPSNGATNVPQNLQTGQTGSICGGTNGTTICDILIGISPTNPSLGIGYPIVDSSVFNQDAISISAPNDSNLMVRWTGNTEGENSGMDFYHTFSFLITNSSFPNGVILMPNTTYTITIRGGTNGLRAYYQPNNQHIDAYLTSDYSWSFTTGNGATPARQQSAPTNTPAFVPNQSSTSTTTATNNQNTATNSQANASNTTTNPQTSNTTKIIKAADKAAYEPTILPSPTAALSSNAQKEVIGAKIKAQTTPSGSVAAMKENNNYLVLAIGIVVLLALGIMLTLRWNAIARFIGKEKKIGI